jgi:hypothetical protein
VLQQFVDGVVQKATFFAVPVVAGRTADAAPGR